MVFGCRGHPAASGFLARNISGTRLQEGSWLGRSVPKSSIPPPPWGLVESSR